VGIRSNNVENILEELVTKKQSEPWYKDGLRFKCTGCGDCCTGAPGYVWVNNAEIADMAKVVDMEVAEFEKTYVRKVGIRKSLNEFSNGDCVFLDTDTRQCELYDARPRQCRTWPFWDSNLKSPEAWAATCEVCPGSGVGKLYDLQHIETERKKMKL
jgi:Fe-S-cluster containining protein